MLLNGNKEGFICWGCFNPCYSPVLPFPFCICASGHVAVCTDKRAKNLPSSAQQMRSHEGRPSFSRPLAPAQPPCSCSSPRFRSRSCLQLPRAPAGTKGHRVAQEVVAPLGCSCRWETPLASPGICDTARLGVLLLALAV